MNKGKVFVAGSTGLVGSAVCRDLMDRGYRVVGAPHGRLDLRDRDSLARYMSAEMPDHVVLAAAKVGGIEANWRMPVQFFVDNMQIQMNMLAVAHAVGVEKLLFLGSSCIYPKHAEQPIKEDALMTGPLEPTNSAYAMAKIGGIELCKAYRRQYGDSFICAMPTNLYGPGDNYHPQYSHVIPGIIQRMHFAKERHDPCVRIWGSGNVRREFLFSEDLAAACAVLLEKYDSEEPINVGAGYDLTIRQLANRIKTVVGFKGEIRYDESKPDGTPRKLLDSTRINQLGWEPKTNLTVGLQRAYEDYLDRHVKP